MIVQYLGFEAKDLVREYSFSVRDVPAEPRAYILTIANEAFQSHRVSYQDGPGICLLRLQTELAKSTPQLEATCFQVTDVELAEYKDSRKEKPPKSWMPRKKED